MSVKADELIYYKLTSCCDPTNVAVFNMIGFSGPLVYEPATYIYIGPDLYYDSFGKALIPGNCYYVESLIGLTQLVLTFNPMPPTTQGGLLGDLLYMGTDGPDIVNSTCSTAIQCPPCESYNLCNECPPNTVDITYTLVGDRCIGEIRDLTFSFPVNKCSCFTLIPCDGVTEPFISSTEELNSYLNQFVNVSNGAWSGCVYVSDLNIAELSSPNCTGSVDVTINDNVECDCESICYYIENAEGITYIQYIDNEDNLLQITPTETSSWLTLCSKVYPIVGNIVNDYRIVALGSCIDNICLPKCFKLIDCLDNTNIIYSNSYNLITYAINNEIVKIAGYNECWTVELTQDDCDCAIDVTVVSSSLNCETCKTLIAYKLISCDNTSNIQYTYQDLSQYVDKTILTDCGCFIVRLINYAPPSVQNITIVTSFNDCVSCKRDYYKLTECNSENSIYTYSNLSDYVDQIVKIANCKGCWTVTQTNVPINPGIVTVTDSYINCITCVTTASCICSNVKNNNTIDYTYRYVDCYGETQSITVKSGETSSKLCLIKWLEPTDSKCIIQSINIDSFVTTHIREASDILLNNKLTWYIDDLLFIYYDNGKWIMNDSLGYPEYYLISTHLNYPVGSWNSFSSIPQEIPVIMFTELCQNSYHFFGDCINGICPIPSIPKKGIKPGYNTSICSSEKYDEISCTSAEIIYKQVLALRYGISNCCPNDDEKYLIEKELIDLASLYNPDYKCKSSNENSGQSSNCNCKQSCNCSNTCNS